MNYSNEILDYLTRMEMPGQITLAPNAPPVVRTIEGIAVALNVVLDAVDVLDTLKAFNVRASQTGSIDTSPSGSFSFGIQNVGRVSVTYITQRNTKVVCLRRIPFNIPAAANVCADPSVIDRLLPCLARGSKALLTLHGPSCLANALIAYLLLNEANQKFRRIMHVIERPLTFLLAHADSVVIQSEVGSDSESFAKAIANARRLGADMLYLGNLSLDDSVTGLVDIIHAGATVMLSGPTLTGPVVRRRLLKEVDGLSEALADLSCVAACVTPAAERRIAVSVSDPAPLLTV